MTSAKEMNQQMKYSGLAVPYFEIRSFPSWLHSFIQPLFSECLPQCEASGSSSKQSQDLY